MILSTKKGNIGIETIVILVVLFVASILILSVYLGFDMMKDDLLGSLKSDQSKEIITREHTNYPKLWDGLLLSLFIGMWIAAITSAFFVKSHPIFFIISLFLLIPSFIIGATLSNIFIDETNSTYSSISSSFPMILFVFNHYLIFGVMIFFTIVIALYAKAVYA